MTNKTETRALIANEVKTSKDEKNLVLIANTNAVDKHRTRITPSGLEFDEYRSNPILLWNHNLEKPLANGCNIREQDGRVILEVPYENFDMEDPEVESIVRKVKKGIIRAASIGFTFSDNDAYPQEDENGNLFVEIRKAKLLEVSLTSVGSNPETLILQRNANNMENLQELETKIDQMLEKLDNLEALVETLNTNFQSSTAEEQTDEAVNTDERKYEEEEKKDEKRSLELSATNIQKLISEALDNALGKS